MVQLLRQPDLTLIELDPSYATLDEESVLEDFGAMLLTEALTAEPPLVLLDLSKTPALPPIFGRKLPRQCLLTLKTSYKAAEKIAVRNCPDG